MALSGAEPFNNPISHPHEWVSAHVIAWISELKNTKKKHLAKVKPDRYKSFKGEVLCNLRKDIFLAFEPGEAGKLLYEDLHEKIRIAREMERSSLERVKLPRQSSTSELEMRISKTSNEFSGYHSPKPMPRSRDLIRDAHVDPHKEEFLEVDDYILRILEQEKLSEPEYWYTNTSPILQSIFNLMPPTGKNFSSHLNPFLPGIVQAPLFRAPMNFPETDNQSDTHAIRNGRFCLVSQVNTVMEGLNGGHLCKGTRQADAMLNSAFVLRPQVQALIHDEVGDMIRPPPVLLIPHTATPGTTGLGFPFPSGDDKPKKSPDYGYDSSNESESTPASKKKEEEGGEKTGSKKQEHKPSMSKGTPSSSSVYSERETQPYWKAEITSFGIQIQAYSVVDTLPLEWDPNLTVDFSVNGALKSPVEQHDEERYISLEVRNPCASPIGFTLRAFTLGRPYQPEMVFPGPYSGVHILESKEVWKMNAELHCNQNEWCILELMVCQISPKKQWNLQRHAVVVKKKLKRSTLKRASQLVAPRKTNDLKAIIGWCVHFVLSSSGYSTGASCADAKVILTQLLHLPDFHRPEMRCFVVACLASLAKNLYETTGARKYIRCMMAFQEHSKELLAASRSTQNPRMVNLCHLTEKMLDGIDLKTILEYNKPKVSKSEGPHRFKTFHDIPVGQLSSDQWLEVESTPLTTANLFLPAHPLDSGAVVKVASVSSDEIRKQMHLDHLSSAVRPICCLYISASPQEMSLKRPYVLHLSMTEESVPLQRDYIIMKAPDFTGPWLDCTESFSVEDLGHKEGQRSVSIKSPLLGWIVPMSIEWRPSLIAQHAMNNLIKEEPVTIKTTVLVSNPSHRATATHILIVFTALNGKRSFLRPPIEVPGRAYKQIGDQQVFQAIVGTQLKIELSGNFVPEKGSDSLDQIVVVPEISDDDKTVEKWVILQPHSDDEYDADLEGRLRVLDIKDGGRRDEVLNIQLRATF